MNLLLSSAAILLGLVLLVGGGDLVIRGAVRIAERIGVSQAMVGTVIVGFGTSLPELAASLDAALEGAPAIAWGNVAGSNIANSLLILGAALMIAPMATREFSAARDPLIGLGAAIVLLVAGLAGWQSAIVGLALLAAIAGYIYWCYRLEEQNSPYAMVSGPHSRAEALEAADPGLHAPRSGLVKPAALFVIGLVLLVMGAKSLIFGASDLALAAGISQAVVGLTVVAIGTSLPELVTSLIAALRKQSGIALGNILGSNIYNILAIGGTILLVAPHSIPDSIAAFEFPMLVLLSLLLWLAVLSKRSIPRSFGFLLLASYGLYLSYSVLSSG